MQLTKHLTAAGGASNAANKASNRYQMKCRKAAGEVSDHSQRASRYWRSGLDKLRLSLFVVYRVEMAFFLCNGAVHHNWKNLLVPRLARRL